MEIESKVTGSALTASEFNQIPDELENLISKSGQTASSSDLTQLTKAVAQFAGDGDFYSTSGTANAIVLTAVSPRLAPPALTNGLKVRFKANYDNTNVVTVNVNNLGAKNITIGGENADIGKIQQNRFYVLMYSSSTDSFELFESGSGGSSYTPPLFCPLQSDHYYNDIQWLRADTFSWHTGGLYPLAYNTLLNEYNDQNSTTEHDINLADKNFRENGNVDIRNGIAYNFNTSDYVSIDDKFNPQSYSWEMQFKFKTTSDITTNQCLECFSSSSEYGLSLHIYNSSLNTYISSTGNSWDIANASPLSVTLQPYTEYWIRISFDLTKYEYKISTDNLNYTTIGTFSTTSPVHSYYMRFGLNEQYSARFTGSIDFKECYIKINNQIWWQGYNQIEYKRTPSGYKIADKTQEQAILKKYNKLGIAWYYILDTTGEMFKLPRTKFDFAGLRNLVGQDVDETLPDIKGAFGAPQLYAGSKAFKTTGTGVIWSSAGQGANQVAEFSASWYNTTYKDKAPVQPRATQLYLYFYVGEYEKSAISQTAGMNAEMFNNKIDLDLQNLDTDNFNSQQKDFIGLQNMPARKYENLTLGATDAHYVMPANGWINFKFTTGSAGYFRIYKWGTTDLSEQMQVGTSLGAGEWGGLMFPVFKDEDIAIIYTGSITSYALTFYYTEGSKGDN